jgi:tetratricopeptide (TPR) repeat protein
VALVGVLGPTIWKTPTVAVQKGEPSSSHTLPTPTAVKKSEEAVQRKALASNAKEQPPAQARKAPTYRSMWPFSTVRKEQGCDRLARFQGKQSEQKASVRCSLYSPWIAYLILETSSKPACNLEEVFGMASAAIRTGKLCGRGHAFLSAYYSYKKVLDRSRSFLEQALQLSPNDPWVKLVEAVVHERDFRDSEKAMRMLKNLLREKGSFSLAQYQLGKLYIAKEKFAKARDLFLLLEQAFPEQPGFMRIQRSLASIEDAPYYSAEMARGLLKVSRALSDLMDYPLAVQLYRRVLEEMPDTLGRSERKSAFYDLGRISEIIGDEETAYTCYRNALRIDPFYRDARERMGAILKGGAQSS